MTTPDHTPPPPPPLPGSLLTPPPGSTSTAATVTISGTKVALPWPAKVQDESYTVCGAKVAVVLFGTSYIMFNLDGLLIESNIDPVDAQSLAPLVDRLTAGEPNVDWPCPIDEGSPSAFTVNGVPIYLPHGARQIGPPTGSLPPHISTIQIGASWVRYSMPDGVLLEADVKAEDAAILKSLLDGLNKPVVHTTDDALRIFAPYLSKLALPDSVSYVETTAGQANAMFEPTRVWEVAADAPAWAVVARGEWLADQRDLRDPPPVPTVWVIVPKGVAGAIFVGTDDRVPFGGIDLSKLGTVVSIAPSIVQKP